MPDLLSVLQAKPAANGLVQRIVGIENLAETSFSDVLQSLGTQVNEGADPGLVETIENEGPQTEAEPEQAEDPGLGIEDPTAEGLPREQTHAPSKADNQQSTPTTVVETEPGNESAELPKHVHSPEKGESELEDATDPERTPSFKMPADVSEGTRPTSLTETSGQFAAPKDQIGTSVATQEPKRQYAESGTDTAELQPVDTKGLRTKGEANPALSVLSQTMLQAEVGESELSMDKEVILARSRAYTEEFRMSMTESQSEDTVLRAPAISSPTMSVSFTPSGMPVLTTHAPVAGLASASTVHPESTKHGVIPQAVTSGVDSSRQQIVIPAGGPKSMVSAETRPTDALLATAVNELVSKADGYQRNLPAGSVVQQQKSSDFPTLNSGKTNDSTFRVSPAGTAVGSEKVAQAAVFDTRVTQSPVPAMPIVQRVISDDPLVKEMTHHLVVSSEKTPVHGRPNPERFASDVATAQPWSQSSVKEMSASVPAAPDTKGQLAERMYQTFTQVGQVSETSLSAVQISETSKHAQPSSLGSFVHPYLPSPEPAKAELPQTIARHATLPQPNLASNYDALEAARPTSEKAVLSQIQVGPGSVESLPDSFASVPAETDSRPAQMERSMPNASARSPETAREIARQMTPSISAALDGQVDIGLSPKELGNVRMSMTISETGLTLIVAAERGETMELMRRYSDEMRAAFRDLGFDNIEFSFSSHEHFGKSERSETTSHDTTDDNPDSPELDADVDVTTPKLTVTDGGLDLRL